MGLVQYFNVPLLGDDAFVENVLVHWLQLQVLYLKKDLYEESLHDTVVDSLDVLLKLRLIVFAIDISSYFVGGMLIIPGL